MPALLRPSRGATFAAALALSTLALTSAGRAEAYTHYTERWLSSVDYANYAPDTAAAANFGVVRDTTGAAVEYGWAGQHTWAWGNGNGGYVFRSEYSDVYAMADLANGQLKARSVVTAGANLAGSAANPTLGYRAHNAYASAAFADTITFGDGAGRSYLWSEGEQFTFDFAVDGQIDLPAGHAVPTSHMQPGQTYALVRLKVYRAGEGFSSIEAFQDFGETMDWDNAADVAHFYSLNDAIVNATLAEQYWVLGDNLLPPEWASAANQQFVALDDTGAAQLQFSFAPGGDFEFVLTLETQARIDLAYQNVTSRVDFSHTLTTSFSAPEDAMVYSASGVFPQTLAAVPEPQTHALMIGGLAVLAWAARRRSRG